MSVHYGMSFMNILTDIQTPSSILATPTPRLTTPSNSAGALLLSHPLVTVYKFPLLYFPTIFTFLSVLQCIRWDQLLSTKCMHSMEPSLQIVPASPHGVPLVSPLQLLIPAMASSQELHHLELEHFIPLRMVLVLAWGRWLQA